jgi:hypothetical protein
MKELAQNSRYAQVLHYNLVLEFKRIFIALFIIG